MVKNNDYVQVHYTGSFDSGEVFDTSSDGTPLEFKVGSGMVIPGFDNAVVGMDVNEEKNIKISSADAYGEYDESLIYPFPIEEVKANFEPQVGMTVALHGQDGRQMPAVVKEITDEQVFIDMNHPLAGKDLNFTIKVVEVNDTPQQQSGCSDMNSSGGCSGGCC